MWEEGETKEIRRGKTMNRQQIAKMIRAYGLAAPALEAERLRWLARLTPQEARAIYESLYEAWEHGGRRGGATGQRWTDGASRRSSPRVRRLRAWPLRGASSDPASRSRMEGSRGPHHARLP